MFLTLSQTTIFRRFQTKRICRHFQIRCKWYKLFQMSRKHRGKRRNCSLRAISPFPTVFSKDLYCRHVKTRACFGKTLLNKTTLTTLYQIIRTFNNLQKRGLLKTFWEKEKMLVTSTFLLFPKCSSFQKQTSYYQ